MNRRRIHRRVGRYTLHPRLGGQIDDLFATNLGCQCTETDLSAPRAVVNALERLAGVALISRLDGDDDAVPGRAAFERLAHEAIDLVVARPGALTGSCLHGTNRQDHREKRQQARESVRGHAASRSNLIARDEVRRLSDA